MNQKFFDPEDDGKVQAVSTGPEGADGALSQQLL
jgi:hypothetical protein